MGRPKLPAIKRSCKHCGNEFDVPRTNKKAQFCGNGCKWASSRRIETRTCIACGKEFVIDAWRKKNTCSTECSIVWKTNNLSITRCMQCGNDIVQSRQGRKKKFCNGGVCCRAYKVEQMKMLPHIVKKCTVCGNEFLDASRDGYKNQCSTPCVNKSLSTSVKTICKNCGKDVYSRPNDIQDYCDTECYRFYRNAHPLEFDKPIGHKRKQGGYWKIKIGVGRWMDEHRHVMEKIIGRPLTKKEVVHHVNGNPLDNRPENLKLMTHSEHKKLHYQIERLGFRVLNGELRFMEGDL